MNTIKPILEGIYNNVELRKTIVPLFLGNPGLAKSTIIREFAKEKRVKMVPFVTSQRNPFEISGMAMPDKDVKKMSYWDFDTLLDLKDGDILFFDEVLNGNPTVLNACLTILEEREMISGKKLPDIMIVAAANPQGMMPLTPQIKERFVWYPIKFNSIMWKDYMFDKYSMIKQVSSKLCDLIAKEDFKGDRNYYSGRSVDKAVNMIINDVPTPYEDVIKPILSTLIENKLENKIKIKDGRTLEVGEQITWLDSIRLKNNVNLTNLIENNKEEIISISDNEILIFDKDDNIIGEIKDIDTLKLLYYFSDEDIKNIEKGIKIPYPPGGIWEEFFFKKKIK